MRFTTSSNQLIGWWGGIWSRTPTFWRFQLTGWAAFGILAFPVNLVLSGTVAAALCSCIVRNGFSFALTLGMRAIYARVYQKHKEPGWIAATVGIVSVTAGLLQLPFHYVLGDIFPFEEKTIFAESVYLAIFYYRTGLFTCWSLLYFGIRQMREVMEDDLRLALIESEKREAELQMLRAQMNPHFLFNALNTILADIGKSGQHLKELVQALAEYLRYALENRSKDRVPLRNEFDAIKAYLGVEKARFREELEIECQMEEGIGNKLVPGILMQPLIENAIKYGRKTSPLPLRIRLTVSRPTPQIVRVEVANTGHWLEKESQRTVGGIGLENLRQRLVLLYPGQDCLHVLKNDGRIIVQVDIPVDL